MSATPEQIAIDEKALEAASRAAWDAERELLMIHGGKIAAWEKLDESTKEHERAQARIRVEAYLTATKDAQAERVRVLESALREARAKALEEAAVIAETWFDHHRPKQPEKSRFDIYDIEHWAKSATRLVAEDIRARAALKGEA